MKGAILVHFTSKGPDLAPSDIHMFGPMKETLKGRFSSDEEIIGNKKTFFLTELKNV
jgi:hypothetical protein